MLKEKGTFGSCSCGGDVSFYSNRGVQCDRCGKLYGVWYYVRKKVAKDTCKTDTSSTMLVGTPMLM